MASVLLCAPPRLPQSPVSFPKIAQNLPNESLQSSPETVPAVAR
jgi:hypothetical protein